jgi:hypothetical protein
VPHVSQQYAREYAMWTRMVANWRIRPSASSTQAYLLAAAFVVLASLVRWSFGFFGTPFLPFTTYYPAVLFATYVGGSRVGIFSAVLGGLIGWWAFMPEYFFFTRGRELELLMYVLACGFLIWGADNYRRLAERLQKELLRAVVWVSFSQFRSTVCCCFCCSCGHVGNALALSIMSTAMLRDRVLETRRCRAPN